ncbi:MAG: Na(+)/H(+) antiporter subunit B [Pseudomonadota bacterium]
MRLDVVLRVVSKLLLPFMLMFAAYVQLHGEYGPGGGFQAGVIAGAGIILYGIMFGLPAAQSIMPPKLVEFLVPLGVLIFAGTGVISFFYAMNFLDYSALGPVTGLSEQYAQILGIIVVEIGVLVTVASTMVAIFYGFAGRGQD